MALVKVKVRDGNLSKALQIFKNKVNKSGHLLELKERQAYLKPSVIKHAKNQDVRYKRRKEILK